MGCPRWFIWVWISFGAWAVAQERPNILWITIEDTSPRFIGAYGNTAARTPIIDQLALEGVRFTNAFSTETVCSPSRSTIITGVPTYKSGTGHHRSKYPVPGFIKGFPYYIKREGYYTSNNVKTDYNVANEKSFIKTAWHESSTTAGWWNRDEGQPFFSVFNFTQSHQSRTMSMSYDWYVKNVWDHLPDSVRFGDRDFEMPPIYKDSPEMRKQMARVYNAIALTDIRIGELLQKLEEDGLMDNTIVFFFADHGEGMPRGKTNGSDYGHRVPFIIRFPERYKHLSPWGTSGLVTDELINFEDLAPTVLSLAGIPIPEHMKGRALMGDSRTPPMDYLVLSSDRTDNGPDMVRSVTDGRYIYSRNYMPFLPQQRYIRYLEISDIVRTMRRDFKENRLDSLQRSLFLERPAEYLFDLRKDPWETTNLTGSPEHKAVLDKMRNQLETRLKKARDILFLPEYELGEISRTTTPFQFRQDSKKYPFEKIHAAASLSGKRDKGTLNKQLDFLKNEYPIIRYWAVLGLQSQTSANIRLAERSLKKAINDPYPPVSIYASALMYQHFKDRDALEKLKLYCKNENAHLALLAINAVLYLEDKGAFLETIREFCQIAGHEYKINAACLDYLGILGLVPNSPEN
ncbi:MAG: sulfatase [Bacteroidota bacterium]